MLESLGMRRKLIGPAARDRADQMLQAELGIDQILGQGIEQFRIRGRVGDAHVIERIDDALAEEVGPVAIGDGPREKGILGIDHPVDQVLARIVARRQA